MFLLQNVLFVIVWHHTFRFRLFYVDLYDIRMLFSYQMFYLWFFFTSDFLFSLLIVLRRFVWYQNVVFITGCFTWICLTFRHRLFYMDLFDFSLQVVLHGFVWLFVTGCFTWICLTFRYRLFYVDLFDFLLQVVLRGFVWLFVTGCFTWICLTFHYRLFYVDLFDFSLQVVLCGRSWGSHAACAGHGTDPAHDARPSSHLYGQCFIIIREV